MYTLYETLQHFYKSWQNYTRLYKTSHNSTNMYTTLHKSIRLYRTVHFFCTTILHSFTTLHKIVRKFLQTLQSFIKLDKTLKTKLYTPLQYFLQNYTTNFTNFKNLTTLYTTVHNFTQFLHNSTQLFTYIQNPGELLYNTCTQQITEKFTKQVKTLQLFYSTNFKTIPTLHNSTKLHKIQKFTTLQNQKQNFTEFYKSFKTLQNFNTTLHNFAQVYNILQNSTQVYKRTLHNVMIYKALQKKTIRHCSKLFTNTLHNSTQLLQDFTTSYIHNYAKKTKLY